MINKFREAAGYYAVRSVGATKPGVYKCSLVNNSLFYVRVIVTRFVFNLTITVGLVQHIFVHYITSAYDF